MDFSASGDTFVCHSTKLLSDVLYATVATGMD